MNLGKVALPINCQRKYHHHSDGLFGYRTRTILRWFIDVVFQILKYNPSNTTHILYMYKRIQASANYINTIIGLYTQDDNNYNFQPRSCHAEISIFTIFNPRANIKTYSFKILYFIFLPAQPEWRLSDKPKHVAVCTYKECMLRLRNCKLVSLLELKLFHPFFGRTQNLLSLGLYWWRGGSAFGFQAAFPHAIPPFRECLSLMNWQQFFSNIFTAFTTCHTVFCSHSEQTNFRRLHSSNLFSRQRPALRCM
jgi:hypothetical protein